MTTQFQDTPLTILKSILMFPDTRNYIGSEYPGLIQRMEKVVNEQDANQALIAEMQVELGKLKTENVNQAAEIARLRGALDKIKDYDDSMDYSADLNECVNIAREALQAQEVAK